MRLLSKITILPKQGTSHTQKSDNIINKDKSAGK